MQKANSIVNIDIAPLPPKQAFNCNEWFSLYLKPRVMNISTYRILKANNILLQGNALLLSSEFTDSSVRIHLLCISLCRNKSLQNISKNQ